jgi:hypothetical protein
METLKQVYDALSTLSVSVVQIVAEEEQQLWSHTTMRHQHRRV